MADFDDFHVPFDGDLFVPDREDSVAKLLQDDDITRAAQTVDDDLEPDDDVAYDSEIPDENDPVDVALLRAIRAMRDLADRNLDPGSDSDSDGPHEEVVFADEKLLPYL